MADYKAKFKTMEPIRVKNVDKFKEALSVWDGVDVVEKNNEKISILADISIPCFYVNKELETVERHLVDVVQEHLVDGETAYLIEIGSQKFAQLNAVAVWVTPDDQGWVDLQVAVKEAAEQAIFNA